MRWTTEKPEAPGMYLYYSTDTWEHRGSPGQYWHKGGPLPDWWVHKRHEAFLGPLADAPEYRAVVLSDWAEAVRKHLSTSEASRFDMGGYLRELGSALSQTESGGE